MAWDYFLYLESRAKLEDLHRVIFVKDRSDCINKQQHFDFICLVALKYFRVSFTLTPSWRKGRESLPFPFYCSRRKLRNQPKTTRHNQVFIGLLAWTLDNTHLSSQQMSSEHPHLLCARHCYRP